jgi:hypothetical protein
MAIKAKKNRDTGKEGKMTFIVLSRNAKWAVEAVVAPSGYYRKSDGSGYVKDRTPSPEMGPIGLAYHFKSHRAAAQVASKLAFPIIQQIGGAK